MKKLLIAIILVVPFIFYCQKNDKKLDSLLNKYSLKTGIEKAETAKIIGAYFKKNSQYYKAIEYQQIAQDIYQSVAALTPAEKSKNIALCNSNIGAAYFFIGDHKKAMEYYIKAYKDIPDNIDLLLNMQGVFSSQDNYEKAFGYAELAMKVAEKTKNFSQLDRIWAIKSDIYFSKKDTINAFKALEKSIEYSKKENDFEQLAITYTNYGDVLKEANKKIDFYLKSKALWDKYQPSSLLAISTNISIANFYRSIVDNPKLLTQKNLTRIEAINKAENILLAQIQNCKKIKHRGKNLQYSLECLSYVYELKNDYKNANNYFKECVVLYDSLNSIDTKNKILNVESSFKIGEKDKEIQLNHKIIEQEKKQKWFYITGILLLAIIGMLVAYQSKNRKKTNQKLQLLNTELDASNKAKTRFFSVLNHDLRAPVANLISFLQLQKESPELLDDLTKKRMQDKTISGAENLLTAMEDILQWSKSQMENFKPQPQNIAINLLFDDLKNHFLSEEKIKILYQNTANIIINTDQNYLKTILRNLTANATKALQDIENPTIVWKAYQKNGNTFLSISDNGQGATNEQLKALYNDKEVSGIKTGLGLHLIRDLAHAINCEIKVESKHQIGTTFELKFI